MSLLLSTAIAVYTPAYTYHNFLSWPTNFNAMKAFTSLAVLLGMLVGVVINLILQEIHYIYLWWSLALMPSCPSNFKNWWGEMGWYRSCLSYSEVSRSNSIYRALLKLGRKRFILCNMNWSNGMYAKKRLKNQWNGNFPWWSETGWNIFSAFVIKFPKT